jgi:hypothetical protein
MGSVGRVSPKGVTRRLPTMNGGIRFAIPPYSAGVTLMLG